MHRHDLLLTAGMFLTLLSHNAVAAFPCMGGPGEFQMGMDTVANMPLCDRREDSFDGASVAPPRTFTNNDTSIAGRVGAVISMLNSIARKPADSKAEAQENPEYTHLKAGYWDFAKPHKGAPKSWG